MRRFTTCHLALLLAGCFKPTFTPVRPGAAIAPDSVVLVGSFTSDPPIEQHGLPRGDCRGMWVNGRWEPPPKIVFVQETDGNVMAFFTRDLSEKWSSEQHKVLKVYDWTYMPLDGHFFVQVPRVRRLHLRGFTYLTNAGSRMFELPAHVDLSPSDRVVYLGEIRIQRGGARRAEFRSALDKARKAARDRGLQSLLKSPWKVRLLKTTGSGPSLGEEWGDSCSRGWSRH
jgi:hypothetical protein